MQPNYKLIETRFKESIDMYVKDRIETGSFLRYVLENDLKGAIGCADYGALDNLPHIVSYIYNRIPWECQGSKERVASWLNQSQSC